MPQYAPERRSNRAISALATILWIATGISTLILTTFGAFIAMWAVGSTTLGPLLMLLVDLGYFGIFFALSRVSVLRSMTKAGRSLFLAALASPLPTGLTIHIAIAW
jgi:hypothetical protein